MIELGLTQTHIILFLLMEPVVMILKCVLMVGGMFLLVKARSGVVLVVKAVNIFQLDHLVLQLSKRPGLFLMLHLFSLYLSLEILFHLGILLRLLLVDNHG
jgi:hypothetical protein